MAHTHSFVSVELAAQYAVGMISPCASYAAARLPNHPFLALRVHFADLGAAGGPFLAPEKTALYVVSPNKPTGRYAGHYFALAPACPTETRTLNVQPPLHTAHSLYLHTLPVLMESYSFNAAASAAAAKVALPNKVDDHDLRAFCRASKEDFMADIKSIRAAEALERRSKGMTTAEAGWDTWSGGGGGGIRHDLRNIVYRYVSFENVSLSMSPSILGDLRLLQK